MKDYKKMWEKLKGDLEDFEKQAAGEGAEEEAEAYAAVRIQMQFLEKKH